MRHLKTSKMPRQIKNSLKLNLKNLMFIKKNSKNKLKKDKNPSLQQSKNKNPKKQPIKDQKISSKNK